MGQGAWYNHASRPPVRLRDGAAVYRTPQSVAVAAPILMAVAVTVVCCAPSRSGLALVYVLVGMVLGAVT